MRGVVTLAAAAAIPVTSAGEPFPDRATLQLAAYTVAIGTLLIQGLSLPWVIARLGVGSADESARDAAQEAAVRVATADAVHAVLERRRADWSDAPRPRAGRRAHRQAVRRLARPRHGGRGHARSRLGGRAGPRRPLEPPGVTGAMRAIDPSYVPTSQDGLRTQGLRREIVAAQREVLMSRRDSGEIDETVMRRMLRELDLEDESLSSSWVTRVQRR